MGTKPAPQELEIEAESLDKAREMLVSKLPKGISILSEKVVVDGTAKTTKCTGESVDEALKKARKKVPAGARIKKTNEIPPELKSLLIEAFDEKEAEKMVQGKEKGPIVIKDIIFDAAGKKGFLGIGRSPNTYKVNILSPAVVEITFVPLVKVLFTTGKTRAKFDEHYILKCKECGFVHHIPNTCSGDNFKFFANPDVIKITCVYAESFWLSLEIKEFFEMETVPASGDYLFASIKDNMEILHPHLLTHYDPLILNLEQTPSQTVHRYSRKQESKTFIKYSKQHGTDIVGNIDIKKAEVPGVSW